MIWGGDWGAPHIKHSFVDSVHVQRCTVARQGTFSLAHGFRTKPTIPARTIKNLLASVIKPPTRASTAAGKARPGFKRT